MHVLVASPLFPPDTARPACYVKELAQRLAEHHKVTVITYGAYPEQVSKVRIVSTNTRMPLLTRLVRYTHTLWKEARSVDVIYAINGASVELPLLLVSLGLRIPIIFGMVDTPTHTVTKHHFLRGLLEKSVALRAYFVVYSIPPPRPEILPFGPTPVEAQGVYERSWQAHLAILERNLSYAP